MGHPFKGLDIHVYPSSFEFESRILKITRTLVARSIAEQVLVIATAKQGLPEQEAIDAKRRVLRVGTRLHGGRSLFKILRFIEWSTRVLFALRRERVAMVNCHSLSVLPLCVMLKWWRNTVLVYEPHELETETTTMRGALKRVAKWVERILIRHADRVIVVSNSIAAYYRRDYAWPDVAVILNVPELEAVAAGGSNSLLRSRFGIPDNHLIFTYQGVLSEDRGLLWLLDAFRRVPSSRHLVFMGFGPLEEKVRLAAQATTNIHLHPAVPPSEIVRYTQGADVGFALLSDDCINHRCALPNKLFHYLHAGVPVIASDLEEMGSVVDRYGCGWRVQNNVAALAACVSAVDAAGLETRRAGALRARGELHWGHEEEKLVSIYSGLFGREQATEINK